MHHHLSFLPDFVLVEVNKLDSVQVHDGDRSSQPTATHDLYAEGNMANISETILINITSEPGIVENVLIGADCSPDEIITYTALFKEFRDVFSWSY